MSAVAAALEPYHELAALKGLLREAIGLGIRLRLSGAGRDAPGGQLQASSLLPQTLPVNECLGLYWCGINSTVPISRGIRNR